MNETEIRALLTVALMSALVDGSNDDREREALRVLASRIRHDSVDLADVYDDVLVRRVALADVVRLLTSAERKRQAYEIAVAVADADGAHTPAEGDFLAELAAALGIAPGQAHDVMAEADRVADAATAPNPDDAPRTAQGTLVANDAALDALILDAAITNAALELLPETLASMAILPLQVRLVYRIGQAHGHVLDQGHIKEFIATLGVGLTGQYIEQFGRRLLGGLLGRVMGGVGRAVGHQAASSGMAFATTWAIGQVAKQYYGGGRKLDAGRLAAVFDPLLARGRGLVTQYAPAIARRAQSIDLRNLPQLIRQL